MGATSASGAATMAGGSVSSSTVEEGDTVVVAGICPLGKVAEEEIVDVAGGSTKIGSCGSTSSRILAELAHDKRVAASKKRPQAALSVVLVAAKRVFAIVDFAQNNMNDFERVSLMEKIVVHLGIYSSTD